MPMPRGFSLAVEPLGRQCDATLWIRGFLDSRRVGGLYGFMEGLGFLEETCDDGEVDRCCAARSIEDLIDEKTDQRHDGTVSRLNVLRSLGRKKKRDHCRMSAQHHAQ